ncbi:hypothetical protein DAI22_12g167100 [Oryza sativa Japonica Group]|nr:hypothetical protein DAI22_12g167100 [Oryza sativa Japonica Group]
MLAMLHNHIRATRLSRMAPPSRIMPHLFSGWVRLQLSKSPTHQIGLQSLDHRL